MVDVQAFAVRLPAVTELAVVVLAAWLIAGWLLPLDNRANDVELTTTGKNAVSLDMALLMNTPLFGDAGTKVNTPEPVKNNVAPSRLNIKLIGTVVADDKSAAVVVMQGEKEQQLFFIGDAMKPGVILQAVEANAIVVDNHKRLERIELQEGKNTLIASIASTTVATAHPQRGGDGGGGELDGGPVLPHGFHQCAVRPELRRHQHHPHLRAHTAHLPGGGVLLHQPAA